MCINKDKKYTVVEMNLYSTHHKEKKWHLIQILIKEYFLFNFAVYLIKMILYIFWTPKQCIGIHVSFLYETLL